MQAVSDKYTKVSLDTAERVGNQLSTRLARAGVNVEFRLQGSVPLDVHIRRVSDVDLLTIDTNFLVYNQQGAKSLQGGYSSATLKTSLSVLRTLRAQVEADLPDAFPAATVDASGAKAVSIEGGSLPRVVDVVPSHWYDTVTYQSSKEQSDRGIYILNKKTGETIQNFPFMHIKRISDRCGETSGGLRKSIRLCKSVKADAIAEGTAINFPSFDIAATMYHADATALMIGGYFELGILAETQRHLDYIARDHNHAKTLMVPDGSRTIFDTNAKLAGLNQLSIEMDDLLRKVAGEQSAVISAWSTLEECREAMKYLKL
jgi:hypothetical protein